MRVNADNIPESLKEYPNWVLWRLETIDGRPNVKLPYSVTGAPASVSDPETWASFHEVWEVYQRDPGAYSGIGFVFDGWNVLGVDLDGCLDGGRLADWAEEFIKRYPSYCEVSPSRKGVKLFYSGSLPRGKRIDVFWRDPICDKNPAIEIYGVKRYFAVTGWRFGEETELREIDIRDLQKRYISLHIHDVKERARQYLARIEPAISGQGGHNKTFYVACILAIGFALPRDAVVELLQEYNRRCQPPWSYRELMHKVDDAFRRRESQKNRLGYLLGFTDEELAREPLPDYKDVVGLVVPKVSVNSIAAQRFDEIAKVTTLYSTGLSDLDYAIGGGLELGEMVVIAGRPGHGKSAFAIQLAAHLCGLGLPALYISEEMGQIQIIRRLLQHATGVQPEDWQRFRNDVERQFRDFLASRAELFIAESCGTVDAAVSAIDAAVKNDGVRVVVVDYVQLLRSRVSAGRYETVTEVSIALRQAATRNKVLMLALCQLNRAIEGRDSQIVSLSDLRDSGQIEQDADVVFFLVHPWKLKWSDDPMEFRVFVLKNRNRPINSTCVACCFQADRQRFVESRQATDDVDFEIPF